MSHFGSDASNLFPSSSSRSLLLSIPFHLRHRKRLESFVLASSRLPPIFTADDFMFSHQQKETLDFPSSPASSASSFPSFVPSLFLPITTPPTDAFSSVQPIAMYTSRIYARAAARSPSGRAAPEERLWFGILGAALIPISLFWLGWSSRPDVHWLAPTSSGVIFGIAQLGLTMFVHSLFLRSSLPLPSRALISLRFLLPFDFDRSVLAYFSDTYQYQMGSVLAGSNFLRFLFGGFFPLFSTQMFKKLGAGWACSLLGFLCFVFFPAPILFYVSPPLARELDSFLNRRSHLSLSLSVVLTRPFGSTRFIQVFGERIRRWSKFVPSQAGVEDNEKDAVVVEADGDEEAQRRREGGVGGS